MYKSSFPHRLDSFAEDPIWVYISGNNMPSELECKSTSHKLDTFFIKTYIQKNTLSKVIKKLLQVEWHPGLKHIY
jgi:hypothetical protein